MIAGEHHRKTGNLNFIFTSDRALLEINNHYLQHDDLTDIITFDYSEHSIIQGDIYISVERVKENASMYNTSFNNELKRVIIHGVLHLVGLHDKTREEKRTMRNAEDRALSLAEDLIIT